jgi:hypothetical protein
MPVRAILTSHPVAVTLSHVVQCAAHLDEVHAPRLLNLHRAGAEHHQVADSRRAATYYSVSLGLPQGRLKYAPVGTRTKSEPRSPPADAGVRLHRPPELIATSAARSH